MLLRSATADDADALLALYRAADLAELGHARTTAADITDLLHAPGLDLPTRSRVAVADDGIVGLLLCHPAPQPGQVRAQLCVARGEVDLAGTFLATLHEWVGPNTPVTLFQSPHSPAAPALRSAGWTKVHSYTRMIADVADHPGARVPRGVRIRAAESQADLATVHRVLETAVAGHWNHQRRDFPSFLADQRQRDGHDPSLWLLAESGGGAVGAVIARAPAGRAWIAWLGVLPEARGHGIAGGLLGSAFARLRERGHTTVGVDVDTHNDTNAVEVYRRAGMRPVGTADQWYVTHV